MAGLKFSGNDRPKIYSGAQVIINHSENLSAVEHKAKLLLILRKKRKQCWPIRAVIGLGKESSLPL
jgi:hypothetical protein